MLARDIMVLHAAKFITDQPVVKERFGELMLGIGHPVKEFDKYFYTFFPQSRKENRMPNFLL